MEYILSAGQMKQCDCYTSEYFGIPSIVLMERAALETVYTMFELKLDMSQVLVVCGTGNNGGDGIAIARILKEKNIPVTITLFGDTERCSGDTKKQLEIAGKYKIPMNNYIDKNAYTVVVDALFGIGLNRTLSAEHQELIAKMNALKKENAVIVAVDIASGIAADTGKIMGNAVVADYTVTYAFKKTGQLLYPGAACTGALIKRDIGITELSLSSHETYITSLEKSDGKLNNRRAYSNKASYGKALLIVGSKAMGGAAVLAVKACFKSGVGLVHVITHEMNRQLIIEAVPEAIVTVYNETIEDDKLEKAMDWADVIGIGPGISLDDMAMHLLEQVFNKSQKNLLIDADAITLLAKRKELLKAASQRTVIMTPHIGEFCRFTGLEKETVLENLPEVVRNMAMQEQLVCVCKDARTIIADAEGNCSINVSGNSGMASAGTGDALFGILCGLTAQGLPFFEAARLGVYLHGCAGDIAALRHGEHGMLSSDLIEAYSSILG